mmetsp:Transcript_4063/g.6908  ORF Transcript_4063/g.6908 Transcript_4063/m.6908 type:complete len:93 (+) Transcript_4063:400-678(+)
MGMHVSSLPRSRQQAFKLLHMAIRAFEAANETVARTSLHGVLVGGGQQSRSVKRSSMAANIHDSSMPHIAARTLIRASILHPRRSDCFAQYA